MLIIGLLPFVIYASIVVIGMAVSLAFGPLHPPDDRPRPINREKFATLECGNLTPEQREAIRLEWYERHKGSGNAATLRGYELAKDAVARATTDRKPLR